MYLFDSYRHTDQPICVKSTLWIRKSGMYRPQHMKTCTHCFPDIVHTWGGSAFKVILAEIAMRQQAFSLISSKIWPSSVRAFSILHSLHSRWQPELTLSMKCFEGHWELHFWRLTSMGSPREVPVPCISRARMSQAGIVPWANAALMIFCWLGPLGAYNKSRQDFLSYSHQQAQFRPQSFPASISER